MAKRVLGWVAAAVTVASGLGCTDYGTGVVDTAEATYVYDDGAWVDYDAAVSYAMIDPWEDFYYDFRAQQPMEDKGAPVSPESLAQKTVDGASKYFTPEGCLTATRNGATATLQLTHCKGPLEAKDINGTLTGTFAQGTSGGSYTVDVTSNNLTIDGRAGQLKLKGTATRDGDQRLFASTSTGSFTSKNGKNVQRNEQSQIRWTQGSGCISAESNGSLVVDGTTYTSNLTGYERCAGQCASAGTFSLDGPSRDVTVSFDGTANPEISSSRNGKGNLELTCTPTGAAPPPADGGGTGTGY